MVTSILKNITIVNHNEMFVGDIHINGNKIQKVVKKTGKKINLNYFLVPGFVDIHTHGGYGFSFNDLSKSISINNVYKYYKYLFNEGVTSVVGTSVTCSINELKAIYLNLMELMKDKNSPIIGWHIEGPFISKLKCGAQDPKHIVPMSTKNNKLIISWNKIKKIITIAPEIKNNMHFIKSLSKHMVVSIGHTTANAKDTSDAVKLGAKHLTHFYNAMSKFNHRNPTIINEAFINKSCVCELISDLIHVEKITILDTYKILGPDRIILITDSLSCKGEPNGNYMLGSLPIVKYDSIAILKDNSSIAGSVQPYILQLKNFYETTKCSLCDLVKISSYNAAKSLNLLNKFGEIKKNNYANFVILDKNLNIKKVYFNGGEQLNETN